MKTLDDSIVDPTNEQVSDNIWQHMMHLYKEVDKYSTCPENYLTYLLSLFANLSLRCLWQAVADFLLNVCNSLGGLGQLETMCIEFVTEYTDDIIEMLVGQFLEPEMVCTAISACP